MLRWLDEAGPIVRASGWGPVLSAGGVDAWEALYAPLYLCLLQFVRSDDADMCAEPIPARLSQRIRLLGYRLKSWLRKWAATQKSDALPAAEILFWPRDLTHIKAELPVAKALWAQGESAAFVVCQPHTLHELQARHMPATFLPALWYREKRAARKQGRQLAKQLATVDVALPTLGSPARRASLRQMVESVLANGLPDVEVAAVHARGILNRIKPRVLVVGHDITLEGRTACLLARQAGVPTATLQHGSVSGNPILARHVADRLLVFGERARRELKKVGIADERIVLCGAPYLDDCPGQTGRPNPVIAERLGLRPNQPLVLVATSGPGHSVSHRHHEMIVDAVSKLSAKLPDALFVAKLHRKDLIDYYRRAQKRHPDSRLHVVRHGEPGYPEDIFDWLQGCALVITGASTVANEAMFMDVPVVTADFAGELQRVNFIDAGATTHVTSPAELEQAVEQIVHAPAVAAAARQRGKEYVRETYFALDGHSAQRAAEALLQLKK